MTAVMNKRKKAPAVLNAFLNSLTNLTWSLIDLVCSVFSFVFYLFVVGLGLYGMASVVYNLVLVHQRRREERPEPPTARVVGTVYPDRGKVKEK